MSVSFRPGDRVRRRAQPHIVGVVERVLGPDGSRGRARVRWLDATRRITGGTATHSTVLISALELAGDNAEQARALAQARHVALARTVQDRLDTGQRDVGARYWINRGLPTAGARRRHLIGLSSDELILLYHLATAAFHGRGEWPE